MILLRFLSLLAGALLLVLPPLLIFGSAAKPEFYDARTVAGMLAALALLATSFFFIGLAGDRMRKSSALRTIGALLLALPFLAGLALLVRADGVALMVGGALLVTLATTLFAGFVFPAGGSGKHRPMRRREAREPKLGRLALD